MTEQIYNLHPLVVPLLNNVVLIDKNDPLRLDLPCLHIFNDHRFNKNLRSLAWLIRWLSNRTGNRKYYSANINAEEMAEAKITAIKIMQKEAFGEELRILKNNNRINKSKCTNLRL